MRIKPKMPMTYIPDYGISLANYNPYSLEIIVRKEGDMAKGANKPAKAAKKKKGKKK